MNKHKSKKTIKRFNCKNRLIFFLHMPFANIEEKMMRNEVIICMVNCNLNKK